MGHENHTRQSSMDVRLEPQTQLVSRIGLATKDASKFSFVHGKPGVGKSYVVNLLQQQLPNTLVVKLVLKNALEPEQLKQQLVCELATHELSDLNQPISSAVMNAVEHHQQSVMIIIDDAELAHQQSLSALWQAIHEFSRMNQTHFTFNVLLVGETRWALPFHHGLKNKTDSLVAEYAVLPLTIQQATDFMMVVHADWSDQKISQFLKKMSPEYLVPKQLIYMQVASNKKSKQKVIVWLTCLVIFLIFSSFAISYLLNQSSTPIIADEKSIEPDIEKTEKLAVVTVLPEISQSISTYDEQQQEVLTEPLPSVQSEAQGNEDALIAENKAPNKVLPQENIALKEDAKLEKIQPLATVIEDKFDEKVLMALPNTDFSLMLGGYSSLLTLEAMQQQFANDQKMRAYSGHRHGKAWYVLLYGDFKSIAAANAFVRENRDKFQGISPWAKSLKSIQSEISIGRLPVDNNK